MGQQAAGPARARQRQHGSVAVRRQGGAWPESSRRCAARKITAKSHRNERARCRAHCGTYLSGAAAPCKRSCAHTWLSWPEIDGNTEKTPGAINQSGIKWQPSFPQNWLVYLSSTNPGKSATRAWILSAEELVAFWARTPVAS